MMDEVRKLLDEHERWLRERTILRQIDTKLVEITTPYLDRHNDYLQIYAMRSNGGFLLTDDGYVLDDLEISGCSLDSDKRQEILRTTLRAFGVERHDRSLQIHATENDFPRKKHCLVQAMLAVNDLFYLAGPTIKSLFYEDVLAWLDDRGVRYLADAVFKGKTGYDYKFHFAIPKSNRQPERYVQTVAHPAKSAVEHLVLQWVDTQDARPRGSRMYGLLNDQEQRVPETVLEALDSYGIRAVLWSSRDKVVEELAA